MKNTYQLHYHYCNYHYCWTQKIYSYYNNKSYDIYEVNTSETMMINNYYCQKDCQLVLRPRSFGEYTEFFLQCACVSENNWWEGHKVVQVHVHCSCIRIGAAASGVNAISHIFFGKGNFNFDWTWQRVTSSSRDTICKWEQRSRFTWCSNKSSVYIKYLGKKGRLRPLREKSSEWGFQYRSWNCKIKLKAPLDLRLFSKWSQNLN